MYLRRSLESTIDKAIETFPAIMITGPRQSGKSTLLKHYFSGRRYTYLSLDNPDVRMLISEDPMHFLSEIEKPVVIDEFQYLPEITSYIKILIDQNREPGVWFLSGSQQFHAMKNVSESLAGRVAVLTLPPFHLKERDVLPDLEGFLSQSSYPELIVNPRIDKKIWYSSYVQTYLERDVRILVNVADLRDFENVLRLLASRTGQELNYSHLAREVGVSVPTIQRWISVLESSYIVFLVPPFFHNFGKRIVKAPKIYFYDIGLVNHLVGIETTPLILRGPMSGPMFETACIAEFIKQKFASGIKPEMYFWRSQGGVEIDLISQEKGVYQPYEIKLSKTIKPSFYRHLLYWIELSGSTEGTGTLITDCAHSLPLPKGINNIHWSKL